MAKPESNALSNYVLLRYMVWNPAFWILYGPLGPLNYWGPFSVYRAS